jgi:hypothetical protein
MARTRCIKPKFFTDSDTGSLDPLVRLLFIGLWTIADRRGILEDKPKQIKALVLPYDDCDVDVMLGILNGEGLILRYNGNGKCCIKIRSFEKHQHPHRAEVASDLPQPSDLLSAPDLHDASTVQAPNKPDTGTIQNGPFTVNCLPLTSNCKPLTLEAEKENRNKNQEEASKSLPSSEYAFECEHFKIKHDQFNRWQQTFKTIDILHQCRGMRDWYDKQLKEGKLTEKEIKQRWFFQLPQAFAKEDLKRKTAMGGASL